MFLVASNSVAYCVRRAKTEERKREKKRERQREIENAEKEKEEERNVCCDYYYFSSDFR